MYLHEHKPRTGFGYFEWLECRHEQSSCPDSQVVLRTLCSKPFYPFNPKSCQFPISPAASPEIKHHIASMKNLAFHRLGWPRSDAILHMSRTQLSSCEVRHLTKLSSADCIWIGWAVLPGWRRHEEQLKVDFGSSTDLHMSQTKVQIFIELPLATLKSFLLVLNLIRPDDFGVWPNQANLINLGRPKLSLSSADVKYGV